MVDWIGTTRAYDDGIAWQTKARLLSFPVDRSCGLLRVAQLDAYGAWSMDAPLFAEARGAVVVPPDVKVCLRVDATLTAADFDTLDWLRADDFLDLTEVEAVDDVLAALISLPELRRVRLPLATTNAHLGILQALPSPARTRAAWYAGDGHRHGSAVRATGSTCP